MVHDPESRTRPTSAGTRIILRTASVLVFLVGVQLFVLTEMTRQFFAWTITAPLTAAFLGAAYWSSCVMELTASRRRSWAAGRIAVPAVLVFTTLTFVISLLHIDLFHLSEPSVMTRFLTWGWLAVYAVVPPVMLLVLLRQVRIPGTDPVRRNPLDSWYRVLLIVHAVLLLPLGILFLLSPTLSDALWPWTLTPLTARAIGAWLVGIGIAAAHAALENDWTRIRPATMSYAAFGVLELVALARYPATVPWSSAHTWLYVIFLISSLVIGLWGWRKAGAHAARAPLSPSPAEPV